VNIDEENHNVGNIIKEEINLFDDREKDRVAENDDFGTEAELIIDKKEKEIENGEDQGKENHEPPRRYNLRPKHCFVVEKRDGKIKARAVADGRSQIPYTEEETYSPMVKLESIMLNAFIDAHEGRYVATVDIKGAFLKGKAPDNMELIVKMTGELSQIMCKKTLI